LIGFSHLPLRPSLDPPPPNYLSQAVFHTDVFFVYKLEFLFFPFCQLFIITYLFFLRSVFSPPKLRCTSPTSPLHEERNFIILCAFFHHIFSSGLAPQILFTDPVLKRHSVERWWRLLLSFIDPHCNLTWSPSKFFAIFPLRLFFTIKVILVVLFQMLYEYWPPDVDLIILRRALFPLPILFASSFCCSSFLVPARSGGALSVFPPLSPQSQLFFLMLGLSNAISFGIFALECLRLLRLRFSHGYPIPLRDLLCALHSLEGPLSNRSLPSRMSTQVAGFTLTFVSFYVLIFLWLLLFLLFCFCWVSGLFFLPE